MTSERPSGASQVVRRELRSSGGDSADLGSSDTAGGGEGLLLLLGLDGAFREVAGGAARLLGWLEGFSGDRGESLLAEWISDGNRRRCLWWGVSSVGRVGEGGWVA